MQHLLLSGNILHRVSPPYYQDYKPMSFNKKKKKLHPL
jgi:hypothetical protein